MKFIEDRLAEIVISKLSGTCVSKIKIFLRIVSPYNLHQSILQGLVELRGHEAIYEYKYKNTHHRFSLNEMLTYIYWRRFGKSSFEEEMQNCTRKPWILLLFKIHTYYTAKRKMLCLGLTFDRIIFSQLILPRKDIFHLT